MVDDAAAVASSDCWAEGLQLGNEAQVEEGHSDSDDVDSSSPPSLTDSSSYAALSLLTNDKHLALYFVSNYEHVEECN